LGDEMLNDFQKQLSEQNRWDFSGLQALLLNCTLKASPQQSHTAGLMGVVREILEDNDVDVEKVRVVDCDIAPGIYPDMTEHGWEVDEWPELYQKVRRAHILVIGTPIWLGDPSSVCSKLIERLYAMSSQLNDDGQYAYYGRVGGCVVTGNEDGIKQCARNVLYALQHLGYVIPPQADCGWVGEAGPGPSYCDEESGGPDNEFTQRNTTFMTWNLMHMARMIADAGGIPAHGNQRSAWDAGCTSEQPNPEHR